ncbi:MAG: HD domain-containing protein [Oscillospiraceae bacterium]|nr:HD domain-containing protein [Oscillospiraceae bacterium]
MKSCAVLSDFSYITIPNFTGDIQSDAKALLLANNKPKTARHITAVAKMNKTIAIQYGLDAAICEISGYLHDISAVITAGDMLSYAIRNSWYIDEAEKKYPFLLHQRISKIIAEQDFGITDKLILSAVNCHSTLQADPSPYDMALFVADKLAWDQDGLPPFYSLVREGLDQSLKAASLAYMEYIVVNKMILHPHKWFEEGKAFLCSC